MKLTVNGKVLDFETGTTLEDVMKTLKKEYDVLLVNGFMADAKTVLNEGNDVVLIKKGEKPSEDEMEALMCGRHTPHVHKKLKASTVAIFGLGGLGSNIANALARIGVGKLILIDFDVVEPSNLNRQAYEIADIGRLKCEALVESLNRINPYNAYIPVNMKVEKEDVPALINGTLEIDDAPCGDIFGTIDVVVEAFDNATYKAMLVNEVLQNTDKPIVSASGMAGLYNPNSIQTKQVMNRLFLAGDGVHEAKAFEGLMAPRVIIAAGHQATMVCQVLLGEIDLEEE